MATPDPLHVGSSFVKQYYRVVAEDPTSITKFYGSSDRVSMGENAADMRPIAAAAAAERFAGASKFDLNAIDAQGSVNGGILLVVTGHIMFPKSRKQFVHTFFLNTMATKKGFYVHNDVLRFLDLPVAEALPVLPTVEEYEDPPPITEEPAQPAPSLISPTFSKSKGELPKSTPGFDTTIPEPPSIPSSISSSKGHIPPAFDSPGHGTEESKEAVIALDGENEKAGSGSWASLVASRKNQQASTIPTPASANGGNSLPSSPARGTSAPPPTPNGKPDANPPNNSTTNPAPSNALAALAKIPVHKRNPDCTLIVKNIDNTTVELEVRNLFETFGECSITVQANRGIAFVDYVTSAPVLAAIAQQPFTLRERTLEIYQKTATATRRKSHHHHHRRNNHSDGGGRGRGGRGRGGGSGGGGPSNNNNSGNNNSNSR